MDDALRVRGTSKIQGLINDGDLMTIQPRSIVRDDEVVVLLADSRKAWQWRTEPMPTRRSTSSVRRL